MIYSQITITLLFAFVSLTQSQGCGQYSPIPLGNDTIQTIDMFDPLLGNITRNYTLNVPYNYDKSKEYPLILYFHGWQDDITDHPYTDVGQKYGVISVYPQGMSDYQNDTDMVSWNVGNAGDSTVTCTPLSYTFCYDSCIELNKCGKCNSYTCYDDVLFVIELLTKIKNQLCIDSTRIYIAGASNGGMFTYYLSSKIPEVANGYMLHFAQPMVGWINTPKQTSESYLLSFHGRADTCIPPKGGVDGDNSWVFESLRNTLNYYGLVQGCDLESWERVITPWDYKPGNNNLACHEFTKGCKGRVMSCMHEGEHGFMPDYSFEFAWWFWSSKYRNDEESLKAKLEQSLLK